jgi:hypothetical protein
MWDWRWPITDIKKEIRQARSEGHESTDFAKLENLLDELSDTYERLESEDIKSETSSGDGAKQQTEHYERYISNLFKKASHYNRIIIAASYVAFFTVWSGVSNFVSPKIYAISAIFTSISLIVFVCWEIGLNLYFARHIRDEAVLFQSSGKEYLAKKEKQQKEVREKEIKASPYWYVVLLITIGFGLLGAGSLIIDVVLNLIINGA